tara:strand:- start:48039 stop:48890 length:852 start_codon:yes stop_codon:yes gene_type:complete
MKIFIQHRDNLQYARNLISAIREHAEVQEGSPTEDCTHFLSLQTGGEDQMLGIRESIPEAKITTYCWDCYEWIWDHTYMFDWRPFGEQCKASDLVMVPSYGQVMRLNQHWGIEEARTMIVPAYAQLFDYDDIADDGYVCDPLRDIPDRHSGWASRACNELNIPYIRVGNTRSWEEYQWIIAHSSFVICPWYEASTGGMSLIEAYNLGKNVLVCDSPYMGAKEYFKERAYYFDPSYESMKQQILNMWENRGSHNEDLQDRKDFCRHEFGISTMAKSIVEALEEQ